METNPMPEGSPEPDRSSVSLEQLRSLLLQPDRREVQEIKRKVAEQAIDAESLSKVLPDAVVRSAQSDHKLAKAMAAPVEEALHESIRRNPKSLAELLFPVIGPAIRRAVVSALQSMQEAINQKLESTLSIKSIRWRLEAVRSGTPYAQIMMAHVLQFRVTHVFLIHAESGLLLDHVAAPDEADIESELVSSMLKAILAFARESFGGGEKDEVDHLRLGAFNLMVEYGPAAILAVTVQGFPSTVLKATMSDTLETVHLEQHQHLRDFSGDASPFATTRPLLEACLIRERVSKRENSVVLREQKRHSRFAVILVLLLIPFLWLLRTHMQWSQYRNALFREPGVTVLASGRAGFGYYVRGFRDPLSRDPASLRQAARLPAGRLQEHWEYYASGTPSFVLARAKPLLDPPPTIQLIYESGTLFPTGSASHAWLTAAGKVEPVLPGGAILSFSRATDQDRARLASLLDALPSQLGFSRGTALTGSGERALQQLAATLRKLPSAAELAGQEVQVTLTGVTDRVGTESGNVKLRWRRARQVKARLVQRGVPANILHEAAADPQVSDTRAVHVSWKVSEKS